MGESGLGFNTCLVNVCEDRPHCSVVFVKQVNYLQIFAIKAHLTRTKEHKLTGDKEPSAKASAFLILCILKGEIYLCILFNFTFISLFRE